MSQWEYLVFSLTDHIWAQQTTELGSLGREGWELVCVDSGVAYLKRPIMQASAFAEDPPGYRRRVELGIPVPPSVDMPLVPRAEFVRRWKEAWELSHLQPVPIGFAPEGYQPQGSGPKGPPPHG